MATKKRASARRFKCIPSTWAAPEVWSKSQNCKKKDRSGKCRRNATAKDGTGGAGFRCYDTVSKKITKQGKCSTRCTPSVKVSFDRKKKLYTLSKTYKRAPR